MEAPLCCSSNRSIMEDDSQYRPLTLESSSISRLFAGRERYWRGMKNRPGSFTLDDIKEDFGRRLKNWIESDEGQTPNGWALADEFMDTGRISKIINGRQNLELKTIVQLINRLGVSMAEFYAGKKASIIEREHAEEFEEFRQLFVHGDPDALSDVMKAIRHAKRDAIERKRESLEKARDKTHPESGRRVAQPQDAAINENKKVGTK